MIDLTSLQECLEESIINLVDDCRGRILSIVEAQLGASPNWGIVRKQLLNVLGERGLEGDIRSSIYDEINSRSDS